MTRAAECNCVIIWDILLEAHVWVGGSFDGSCGHPPTGSEAKVDR